MKKYTPSVLLLYSSRFGQCQKIAETMLNQLEPLGNKCTLINIEEGYKNLPQPASAYHSVVVVASIRYGFYHKKVFSFVKEHLETFKDILDVFVPVNLIARNPLKRTVETNVYVRKFFAKTNWEPDLLNIMPGALNYPQYNFLDRNAIRLIMKMTKGETDTSKTVDYTDWEEVKGFARLIDKALREKRLAILFPKQQFPQLSLEKSSKPAEASVAEPVADEAPVPEADKH